MGFRKRCKILSENTTPFDINKVPDFGFSPEEKEYIMSEKSPEKLFEFFKSKPVGKYGSCGLNDGEKITRILPDGSQEVWSLDGKRIL